MRLVRSLLDHAHNGEVTLTPEDPEDMWHAYNLIQVGDLLHAVAMRKVALDTLGDGEGPAGRKPKTKRVHTKLSIEVASLDFDPGAAELKVAGRVMSENEYVSLGQYHTLDLELNRQFTLVKPDGWDSIARKTLAESTDTKKKAVLWAVVMQEGLANICHITEHQTILKQRIEVPVPRKRLGSSTDNSKGLQRFYDTVLSTLLRQIDVTDTSTPLMLASPGFVASSFRAFIKQTAVSKNNKPLMQLEKRILMAHSSSGHIHSLNEALASPALRSQLADTRFARETQLMDKFFEMIRKDDGKAWYGPKEVERAVEKGAVGRGGGVLLISDTLFRSQNIAERRRWVSLVDRVSQVEGGEVRKLSSLHESGKRLESLGNIAAILTFPIDDEDGDDSDIEDQSAEDAADVAFL